MANAIKYVLPKTQEELNKVVKSGLATVGKMKLAIQIAAVAILYHAEKHGDYTKANELCNGLGNGVQGKSLVKWFETFGGLVVDADDKAKGFTGWKGADHIRKNFQAAQSTLWHDTIKAESPFKPYDINADLKRLLDNYSREQKRFDTLSEAQQAQMNMNKADELLLRQLWKLVDFGPIVESEFDIVNIDDIELPKVAQA